MKLHSHIVSGSYSIRRMTTDDVLFYNETRNEVREHLHDNTFFTLQESENWFSTYCPEFFVAELDGQPIGYFRTSDKVGPRIRIGMDIHRDYRGHGHAKPLYLLFFELLKNSGIDLVDLKVFSINTRAHSLYMKLGFVEISRGIHIRKDGNQFEDILMEKPL